MLQINSGYESFKCSKKVFATLILLQYISCNAACSSPAASTSPRSPRRTAAQARTVGNHNCFMQTNQPHPRPSAPVEFADRYRVSGLCKPTSSHRCTPQHHTTAPPCTATRHRNTSTPHGSTRHSPSTQHNTTPHNTTQQHTPRHNTSTPARQRDVRTWVRPSYPSSLHQPRRTDGCTDGRTDGSA